jgi:GNAT superfamily N-acetyltransferase
MMVEIRPFTKTDNEYAALVAIHKVLEPDEQMTIARLRQSDEDYITDNGLLERFVMEVNGRVAGSGVYFPAEDDNSIMMFAMHIHPDFQESDVPAQMQAHLFAHIAKHQPRTLGSEPKENQTYRVRLLEEAGFALKMRFPRSLLDVAAYDVSLYAHIFEQLATQGIELVTLTDVMPRDEQWQEYIWRLFNQINQDIPSPQPVEEVPFAEYAEYYDGEDFRPDSWQIAVDTNKRGAEQYVGICVVNISSTRAKSLFAGITGTIRSYRRRKIATALKVKSIEYAQRHGYQYILTNNEENNPMYDLNRQLGFQPLPAWLYYEKVL